jgi:hypothetical protein
MRIVAINNNVTDNQVNMFEVVDNSTTLFSGTKDDCKTFIMEEGLKRTIATIKKHSDVFKRLADR